MTGSSSMPGTSNGRATGGRVVGSRRLRPDHQHQRHRQVDQKQPMPAREPQYKARKYRPDEKREAKHCTDEAKRAAAFLDREGIADDRRHHWHDAASADSLHGATGEQLRKTIGEHHQQRTDAEQRDIEHVDVAPTESIGKFRHQWRADQRSEHVDVEDPGALARGDPILAQDIRQRGPDDGDIERAHQNAQEKQQQHCVAS